MGCKSAQDDAIFLDIDQFKDMDGTFPVSMKLDRGLINDIVLYEEIGGTSKEIPCQLDPSTGELWFLARINAKAGKFPNYFIRKGAGQFKKPKVSIERAKADIKFILDQKNVLNYRFGITYPPDGVDSLYKKSGYLHPLMTLKGDTLTRIQPPDHYHHYGIWGPWTRTKIEDRSVDFWNLGEGQGTVLFKNLENTSSGAVFSQMEAVQEHMDLKAEAEKQIALKEDLIVKLWNLDHPDRYMLDYMSSFSSPLNSGVLFEAYRYGGGLGMRFAEKWHKGNTVVLTSEGHDRVKADGTKARWCLVSRTTTDGEVVNGILFMSHPGNQSHPEPMRVWPIDANNERGDMFFEFCPIRHKEWKIRANKIYTLKYRMIVFEGALSAEEAESYWRHFASPPKVQISTTIKSNGI